MDAIDQRELPKDLARVRSRFLAWRERRRAGSRIPQSLWEQAVELVTRYGVSRTSEVLRLDYYSLKKRAEGSAAPSSSGGPAFVELPSPVVVGKQCLFEFDNGSGVTLRVKLVGYDTADVEALARRFGGGE